MQDKQIIGKIVSGISLPMSLLLLIFFFLPWLSLTCSGQDIGKASGFQLARGKMSPGEFAKNPGKMMGKTAAPAKTDEKESGKKLNEAIKARSWGYFGLIIPVILLLVGLLGLKGVAGNSGILLILLGVVGIVMIITASNVEYADDILEHDKKEKAAKADESNAASPMDAMMEEQMKKAFQTTPTGILWWSLVLYILVILCGLASTIVSKISPRINTATPVGPAPPIQA